MHTCRVAAFVAVASLAGCATPANRPPVAAPTTSDAARVAQSTTSTTVALPEPEALQWTACGGGLSCATVHAPIDYADPSRGSLELALVRRPARNPAQRIGSLLVNPGGPGASGVQRVRRGFTVSAEVGARFDLIGFDPRGVGESTPITCGSTVAGFRALDLAPDNAAERAGARRGSTGGRRRVRRHGGHEAGPPRDA